MKKLTCIVCPNGCTLTVEDKTGIMKISGNRCKRGEQFAKDELNHPMRTITSTVRTTFSENPVLPVRVSAEIPKERIKDVMVQINQAVVTTPIPRGSIIISNVLGLGVDIIATSNVLVSMEENEKER